MIGHSPSDNILRLLFPSTLHLSKRNIHSFEYVLPSDPQTGRYILLQMIGHSMSSEIKNRLKKNSKQAICNIYRNT